MDLFPYYLIYDYGLLSPIERKNHAEVVFENGQNRYQIFTNRITYNNKVSDGLIFLISNSLCSRTFLLTLLSKYKKFLWFSKIITSLGMISRQKMNCNNQSTWYKKEKRVW
jgi:hypothetical protein